MTGFRKIIGLGALLGAGLTLVSGGSAHAEGAADFVGGAQHNAKKGVFVAKDLGGGAYWLTTTKSIETMVSASETGSETILTVQDEVVRPVQKAAGL